MLNPFNPQNPDWLQKSIGDLQTAIEMNDVIGAFKANALVLQNLISKINPELVLSTESQIISNSINELKQQLDSFIGFNISEKSLSNGQSFLFPAMSKGEAFVIKIYENDMPNPEGVVWLGGFSGIVAGDGTLVICLTNSLGGSFSEVGHQFVIINQGRDSEVIFVDELPDEHLARTGVIYVLNSNNAMYVWDSQLGDYMLIGDVVPGTLISSTVFEDENNNVVVPEANKLYFDTITEEYYRWDGVQYVPISSTGGGGDIIYTAITLAVLNAGTATTAHTISAKVLTDWLNGKISTVGFSGSYNDLDNKPNIPEQVNLTEGTNIEITGTYPNITISANVEPTEWSQTDW